MMACIKPDGSLSFVAVDILSAMADRTIKPEHIRDRTEHPLYKVRSTIRELNIHGLVEKQGDEELYRMTSAGEEKLKQEREKH